MKGESEQHFRTHKRACNGGSDPESLAAAPSHGPSNSSEWRPHYGDGFPTWLCPAVGQGRKGLGIDRTKAILGGERRGRERVASHEEKGDVSGEPRRRLLTA